MNTAEHSTAAHAIRLENVTRAFGRKKVLNGITASAAPGRIVGLIGRNGEGKTTLFKILLDLLAADGGSIELLGRRPDGSGEIRQLAGYIPERPAFHEFMDAADVLRWRARFFRTWDGQRAADTTRELELDLSTKIKGASKGTLAKLAWVCATAFNPALLLLDEPTSGLDAVVREEVLTHLIRQLSQAGKTILIANHHMEEVATLLDEVWVMHDGRIVATREVDPLRAEACLVTGRLREGAAVPADLPVIAKNGEGPLVRWQVLEQKSFEQIRELNLLDGMERAPLPVETALKLLLVQAETNAGRN